MNHSVTVRAKDSEIPLRIKRELLPPQFGQWRQVVRLNELPSNFAVRCLKVEATSLANIAQRLLRALSEPPIALNTLVLTKRSEIFLT